MRGLSALYLLKAVLDKAAPGQKPCQVFDMIGGTSTGGYVYLAHLIVVMASPDHVLLQLHCHNVGPVTDDD